MNKEQGSMIYKVYCASVKLFDVGVVIDCPVEISQCLLGH